MKNHKSILRSIAGLLFAALLLVVSGAAEAGTEPSPGVVVSVAGQVMRPGKIALQSEHTVLAAIRAAGGFTGAAKSSAVRVSRPQKDAPPLTVVVDCNTAPNEKSEKPNGLFRLQSGDVVYVPEALR